MMKGEHAEVRPPESWARLVERRPRGPVLVLGASDTGKTTFVRWLSGQLARAGETVAWLDGDMGQATLGPPTTMTVAGVKPNGGLDPHRRRSFFVGSTSPRGHMLPTLAGLVRLHDQALAWGARTVVVDTTGFVDPAQGGVELKHWKTEILRPSLIVAFARERELEPLLAPLRRDPRWQLLVYPVEPAVKRWESAERSARRRELYRRYFEGARLQSLPPGLPRYGERRSPVQPGRVLALQDREGFTIALAVLVEDGPRPRVLTPAKELRGVVGLRFGSLALDPETGEER